MTGYEEELVERRQDEPNTAALCNEILARCQVEPGADAAEALQRTRALLVAERDAALVELRRLSLGDRVETRAACPACGETSAVEFSLDALPLEPEPAPPPGRTLEHVLADGTRAVLRLPRAGDQEELFAAGLETESERRSWLLARVLVQYGERPGPFDLDFARGLAVGARNALEAALDAALPRLDLGMEVHCASCGHGFEAPFDVASFFLPR